MAQQRLRHFNIPEKARNLESNIKIGEQRTTEHGTTYIPKSQTPIKTESEYSIFLFVVVYTYNQANNQVEANIIDVFESLGKKSEPDSTFSNSFKLAKTYGEDKEFEKI